VVYRLVAHHEGPFISDKNQNYCTFKIKYDVHRSNSDSRVTETFATYARMNDVLVFMWPRMSSRVSRVKVQFPYINTDVSGYKRDVTLPSNR